ncbi:hypothetical protein TNCV_2617901 [Trichonephila clavipes]|nr:hypothetical protein TNCV_2617901 [Trichonephila clavipes]
MTVQVFTISYCTKSTLAVSGDNMCCYTSTVDPKSLSFNAEAYAVTNRGGNVFNTELIIFLPSPSGLILRVMNLSACAT